MANFSEPLLSRIISDALFGVGAALIIAGILIFGYQSFEWFKIGFWPDMSFGNFWVSNGGSYPHWHWWESDRLVYWLFRQPLAAVSLCAGLLVISARERRNFHRN